MKKIEISKLDEDGTPTDLIAHGQIDNQFYIKIIWASESEHSKISQLAENLNQKNMMHIETGTPPGLNRYGSSSQVITRDNPDFLSALCNYCETYHGVFIEIID